MITSIIQHFHFHDPKVCALGASDAGSDAAGASTASFELFGVEACTFARGGDGVLCGRCLCLPCFSCRMQLAVNAQFPRDLGGLGAQVLYIG
jgi:hypothetical protein